MYLEAVRLWMNGTIDFQNIKNKMVEIPDNWRQRSPVNNGDFKRGSADLNTKEYSKVFLQILALRNLFSEEDIENFLNPSIRSLHDPYLLSGMKRAVNNVYYKNRVLNDRILPFDLEITTSLKCYARLKNGEMRKADVVIFKKTGFVSVSYDQISVLIKGWKDGKFIYDITKNGKLYERNYPKITKIDKDKELKKDNKKKI